MLVRRAAAPLSPHTAARSHRQYEQPCVKIDNTKDSSSSSPRLSKRAPHQHDKLLDVSNRRAEASAPSTRGCVTAVLTPSHISPRKQPGPLSFSPDLIAAENAGLKQAEVKILPWETRIEKLAILSPVSRSPLSD